MVPSEIAIFASRHTFREQRQQHLCKRHLQWLNDPSHRAPDQSPTTVELRQPANNGASAIYTCGNAHTPVISTRVPEIISSRVSARTTQRSRGLMFSPSPPQYQIRRDYFPLRITTAARAEQTYRSSLTKIVLDKRQYGGGDHLGPAILQQQTPTATTTVRTVYHTVEVHPATCTCDV